jgi:trk system potassium uptake protein TrkH
MWRSFIQWVGGIGIIVIFISVFPQLAIAGRQLFFAEAPGPTEERLTPRLRNTANTLLIVYGGLTVACALAYGAAGMGPFDAIAHAFTTLAAGGFSPNPLSFEGSPGAAIDWVASLFMFLAGVNFALQFRVYSGRPRLLLRDPEFRAYAVIVLVAAALLSLFLLEQYRPLDALRHGVFQTLSILTTTGYASADFALWSERAQMVLLMLMFVGGSAGSAAGGVKVVRWLIVARITGREVERALHPRAVLPVRLGTRLVPEEVLRAVAAFITLYVMLFALSTAVLVMLGSDFITAFTASIACIGNIGPGLAAVGPMLSFAELHPLARALLIFDMYAGRLEVVTVFVVFTSSWWRLPRRNMWRARPGSLE